MREVRGRHAPHARFQRAALARRARHQFDLRLDAVFLGDRRRQRAALVEQRGQADHLFPVLCAALGAQLHARGGDVPRPAAAQVAQRITRGRKVALIQRHLRLRQQPRRVQRLARGLGALQPLAAPLVLVHLMGGARGDERGDARRGAGFPGERGLLLGARVAALEIALQRHRQRALGLRASAAFAVGAHLGRQRQRVAHQPQRDVADAERGQRGEHEQQHRHLDAPRRVDEQHVAFAEAAGERHRHRGGEYGDQPKQPAHQPPLKTRRARGGS